MFCPLYLGAEPWVASKIAPSVPMFAPGANVGDEYAVFEAVHGSAPKYKGQNKVNPMALMLSGVMLLRHIEEREAAERLEGAIADVIAEGRSVTYDMKPSRDDPSAVGTSDVADVGAGRHAEPSDEPGPEVGDDVPVQVGQDDDVVLLGP